MVQQNLIRNFCIVAHIDHGKSTLADRLLEITQTVPREKLKPQFLDSLTLERERGITIKLAPVRMNYTLPFGSAQGENPIPYTLNLIDTPGHVDFSYEVSRSLAAVEGVILLVDATQGVQAQTLAHGLAAKDQKLKLIPVVNKIDLPNADITATKKQLKETLGFGKEEILLVSAKTGEGVKKLLQAVVERVPPPQGEKGYPLRALIFDSFFDPYKGVIAQVKIAEGEISRIGTNIYFLGVVTRGEVQELGYFSPQLTPAPSLSAGEIGYLATGIKEPDLVRVGDTISTDPTVRPLPGYKKVKPMVFVGLYPLAPREYTHLRGVLAKFRLNDPAFTFEPEHSAALGAGFRGGFLGSLHAEVVQERLSREFGVEVVATAPSVEYLVGEKQVNNPAKVERASFKEIKEPWVTVKIFTPQSYLGAIISLVQNKRGKLVDIQHLGGQVGLLGEMPLSEMIIDFYDKLKSVSAGFASLDWQFFEYRAADVVRVDVLIAGEKIDALSMMVIKEKAQNVARRSVARLKEVLPRQQFETAIQAAVGGKIIARETLSAYRKDVTAKLYGGDRTRKDKLLEKQKKGKKRMKMVGKVEIPQEAFLAILKS